MFYHCQTHITTLATFSTNLITKNISICHGNKFSLSIECCPEAYPQCCMEMVMTGGGGKGNPDVI